MAVAVDYYAVIDVDRKAGKDAIESAVKKSMREWRKRTEAADLGVRQEAELKVKQIEEARTTLLDPGKRAAYDRELQARGVTEPASRASADSGTTDWLDRAENALALGDYHSAAYAAREATHLDGNNARCWWVRSRANAGLKLWQDALYEAKQAVHLDENNAEFHFNLGCVHEEMGMWNDAITEFRRAGTCDPSNPMYELAVGGIFLQNNRPSEAVGIIEAVYKKHPKDETANYYLGMALIELAESLPRKRTDDGYAVTSEEEIRQMRELAMRAKNLTIVDDEIKEAADHILVYLDKMEQKAWRAPRAMLAGMLEAGAAAGCFGIVVMTGLVGGLVGLPLILFLSGFAAMGTDPGAGFIMLLLGGGLGYVWYRLSYIPRWKHNKKDLG